MSIDFIISKINKELISAFAALDSWFDRQEEFLRAESPAGWNGAQILEHVMLTNHYLLILIEKGSVKARSLAKEKDMLPSLEGYCLSNSALEAIADPGAFSWQRPSHMQPTGNKSLSQVRRELRDQLYRTLCQLDLLAKGEGALYKITMTVNNLGKLDVYQHIYFMALHIKRHLKQLDQFDEIMCGTKTA